MKKLFLISVLSSLSYLSFSQNSFNEATQIRVNKEEELKSSNVIFLDSNKKLNLNKDGAFLYSSYNQTDLSSVGGYENNEDYFITITSLYGNTIMLKSQFVNTELNKDVLKIYDGESTNSNLISTLSGVIDNDIIIKSTGNSITLHFKSDNQNVSKGFRFRIDNGNSNYKISGGGDLPTPQSCSGTPASDECSNAPLICNLNGYCGNTSSAYTAGNTSVLSGWCGSASIENNSWIKFIATSSTASLNIVSGGCQSSSSGIQAAIFATSDCNNFTKVSNCVNQSSGSGAFTISNNTPLIAGQTYYIMIDGYAGNVCNYTVTAQTGVSTSATQIVASQSQVCPGFTTSLSSAVSANSTNSYTWTSTPAGSYPNTQTITVSPSSTTVYTLTMGASPCSSLTTVAVKTIVVTNTLSPANISVSSPVCVGSNINISSLTNGGTYIWSGPSGFSSSTQNNTISNWSSSNNGNYSLTINYGSGCITTPTFVTVTGINPPTVNLTSTTNTICSGSSFTLTASGGSGSNPYTWNWNVLETSVMLQSCIFSVCNDNPAFSFIPQTASAGPKATITPNVSTEICASTTNSGGCSATSCFSISVINCTTTSCPTLTLSVTTQSNVNCFGGNTGSANISTTGGTGAYTYTWLPGNLSGASQSALTAGIYTINVKDANNCTGSTTLAITQPTAPIALNLLGTSPTGCGSATGSATVNATGGTPVYTYSWFPTGGSGTTASNLTAGTYTIGVIDSKGCFTITTANITSAGGPTLSVVSQQSVNCFGANTGSATVNATGGSGAYTYTWMPGNLIGATQTSLSAGIYNIVGADNTGCIGTMTLSIGQPTAALSLNFVGSNPATCGSSNGSATVQATGGSPIYTYSWIPSGGIFSTASNLSPGSYSVGVLDSKSCFSYTIFNVNSANGPTISVTSFSNVTCFGGNNGTAIVTSSGGNGTYTWTPGNLSGATQSALTAGVYNISTKDNSGCISSVTVAITQPTAALTATVLSTNTNCGGSTGSATVIANGGTPGYSYVWTPTGGSNNTANSLGAGNYSVTISDAKSCTIIATTSISSSGGATLSIATQSNVTCFGENDGSASVTVSGGSATYTWLPSGGINSSASNLAAGIYTVVASVSGCVTYTTITITQPTQITISINTTSASCTAADGSATANVTGGTGPYTYTWSNASNGNSLTGVLAGNYTLVASDANGCYATAVANIGTNTGGFAVDAGTGTTIELGQSTTLNGIVPTGATYTWTPAGTLSCYNCLTPVSTPTNTIIYTLNATDANGCLAKDTVIITVNIPCGEVFIPTAFSPNNDGSNDDLLVYGNCIAELELAIFDRWGEKVFETISKTIGWDGTYKGKEMNAGAFAYYAKITLQNGEVINKKGSVNLVR